MNNSRRCVRDKLKEYLNHYPEESQQFSLLCQQLDEKQDIQDRKNMKGHVTSGMFVLNNDLTQVLLSSIFLLVAAPSVNIVMKVELLLKAVKGLILK